MLGYTARLLIPLLLVQQVNHVLGFKYDSQNDMVCSLAPPDFQKITDIFTEATSVGTNAVNITLIELDVKLQQILDLMKVLQTQEKKILKIAEVDANLDSLDEVLADDKKEKIGEAEINEEMNKEQINEEETNEEQPKQQLLTDKTKQHTVDTDLHKQETLILEDKSSNHDNLEEKMNENEIQQEIPRREDETTLFKPITGADIKKGGCEALVQTAHQTIGMFYITSYRHGHCANREPLTEFHIRYCLGYCSSKTFLDRQVGHEWRQGHECYSCQPEQMETISIPLECEDGYTFHKRYSNVVSCKCKPCKPALRI